MKASEVLIQGLAIIEDPARWERYYYASDAEGIPTSPASDDACRWCSIGALWKVTAGPGDGLDVEPCDTGKARAYLSRAAQGLGFSGIVRMNDNASHKKVLKMWKNAIQAAEMCGE